MSVYVVAQATILDADLLNEYAGAAVPIILGAGGKIVAFDENSEVVEGEPPGTRMVILEFEDRAAVSRWYDSDEYQAIIGQRLEAAPGTLLIANGFEMPAG